MMKKNETTCDANGRHPLEYHAESIEDAVENVGDIMDEIKKLSAKALEDCERGNINCEPGITDLQRYAREIVIAGDNLFRIIDRFIKEYY